MVLNYRRSRLERMLLNLSDSPILLCNSPRMFVRLNDFQLFTGVVLRRFGSTLFGRTVLIS